MNPNFARLAMGTALALTLGAAAQAKTLVYCSERPFALGLFLAPHHEAVGALGFLHLPE